MGFVLTWFSCCLRKLSTKPLLALSEHKGPEPAYQTSMQIPAPVLLSCMTLDTARDFSESYLSNGDEHTYFAALLLGSVEYKQTAWYTVGDPRRWLKTITRSSWTPAQTLPPPFLLPNGVTWVWKPFSTEWPDEADQKSIFIFCFTFWIHPYLFVLKAIWSHCTA